MKNLRIVFGEEGSRTGHHIYGDSNLKRFFNGFVAWLVLNTDKCFCPENMIEYYKQLPEDLQGDLFMPFTLDWLHPSETPMSIFVYRCFECGDKIDTTDGKELIKIYKKSPQYRIGFFCKKCVPKIEAQTKKRQKLIKDGKYSP